ncbi:hypothetical protein HAX54_020129 [Datura stramonium]|uniref:Uncharacterized protein n=1 Tax=Datura stramonium TaxID=4076 RepID=A0ABS8USG9_DATST|nr:hypothetical protein [Datura stramonium]
MVAKISRVRSTVLGVAMILLGLTKAVVRAPPPALPLCIYPPFVVRALWPSGTIDSLDEVVGDKANLSFMNALVVGIWYSSPEFVCSSLSRGFIEAEALPPFGAALIGAISYN